VGSKCSQCKHCSRSLHCLTLPDLLLPLSILGTHLQGILSRAVGLLRQVARSSIRGAYWSDPGRGSLQRKLSFMGGEPYRDRSRWHDHPRQLLPHRKRTGHERRASLLHTVRACCAPRLAERQSRRKYGVLMRRKVACFAAISHVLRPGGAPIKAQVWSFDEKKGGLLRSDLTRMCLELSTTRTSKLRIHGSVWVLTSVTSSGGWGVTGLCACSHSVVGRRSVSWYRRLRRLPHRRQHQDRRCSYSGAAGIPF
jgi:hypothetical protein